MTVLFEEECSVPFAFLYQELAERVIREALLFESCPYEAEVNLTLTSNEEIREINYEHREIDKETDVLSFPMIAFDSPGDFDFLEDAYEEYFNLDSEELIMGDIMISVDKVIEQAEEYGHSQEREFAFLIVHSMLHLMGYDHMVSEEAVVMEKRQSEILKRLNIGR